MDGGPALPGTDVTEASSRVAQPTLKGVESVRPGSPRSARLVGEPAGRGSAQRFPGN